MPAEGPQLTTSSVLVTGAARGIGRAIALEFARRGMDLGLVDICRPLAGTPYPLASQQQLEDSASQCRDMGVRCIATVADVRSDQEVQDAVQDTLQRIGPIGVLVNNAGIVMPGGREAHLYSDEEWSLMLDVNLLGACRVARAVLPNMIEMGGGVIINIASVGGLVGYPRFAPYVASKHALVGLTRSMSLDYARYGIRVNAVCPGSVVDDPVHEGRMLQAIATALGLEADIASEALEQQYPAGRLLSADEVAAAVVMLASDDARGITGAILPVDMGYTSR